MLSDGVGVDIAAKLLYGEPFPANLNGTDFIPALLAAEPRPLTIALLGTTRANADAAAAKFSEIAPHHRFIVVHDGYFNAGEEPRILERIEALRPDILLVAMGVPRQEFWIAKNITSRHCTLPIAVGALLDFLSGTVPRAPAWMRSLRLEWVFRLIIEPGRLVAPLCSRQSGLSRSRDASEIFVERAGGNTPVNGPLIAEPAGKPLGEAANVAGTAAIVTASYAPISNAAGCFAKPSTVS